MQNDLEKVAQYFASESDEQSGSAEFASNEIGETTAVAKATSSAVQIANHVGNSAVEFFKARKYQGLVPDLSIEDDLSIRAGSFGIARQYKPI